MRNPKSCSQPGHRQRPAPGKQHATATVQRTRPCQQTRQGVAPAALPARTPGCFSAAAGVCHWQVPGWQVELVCTAADRQVFEQPNKACVRIVGRVVRASCQQATARQCTVIAAGAAQVVGQGVRGGRLRAADPCPVVLRFSSLLMWHNDGSRLAGCCFAGPGVRGHCV